jgi:glycosyltransferase involved in cell wall biosynthesis
LLGNSAGPLLLAVARLEPEKNIGLMLRAVSVLARSVPGVLLAVVGDGSMRRELEQSAPNRNVRWLGRIPNAELGAYYQAADLLLLSSDIESSARVLTEALLAGTPVLTTDTAGAREIVEDGVSGRVVPVGDGTAFASALIELCSNSEHLDRMGNVGRLAARNLSSREVVIDGLRDLYRDVTLRNRRESAAF